AASTAALKTARADVLKLAAAGDFATAAKKLADAKSRALPGDGGAVAEIGAELEKMRAAREVELIAERRKGYAEFSASFRKRALAGEFAKAIAAGKELEGKLPDDLERRLADDLELAVGGEAFMKSLAARLSKTEWNSFVTKLPMGRAGRFRKFNAARREIEFKIGPSWVSVQLADFRGKLLLELAVNAAKAGLSAKESRDAACCLLAQGVSDGVADMVRAAKAGGLDVKLLERRLKLLTKGEAEYEAEQLLNHFDGLLKQKNWTTAVLIGEQLLKKHTAAAAVKARPGLKAQIETARLKSSPLKTYELTLQQGAPLEEVGLAAYAGCESTVVGLRDDRHHVPYSTTGVYLASARMWRSFLRFAVTRREGGPLPDDVEVISARVLLSKRSYIPYLEMRSVLGPWDQKTVCYDSAEAGRKWKTPGGDVADEPAAVCDLPRKYGELEKEERVALWRGPAWCEFDVTESLREALKEGRNYGWRLDAHKNEKHEAHLNLVRMAGPNFDDDRARRPKLILKVRCRRLPGDR
ncbi:MAG: hypothetical protein ACYTGB_18970, partial [Planctomycetota bacterium]